MFGPRLVMSTFYGDSARYFGACYEGTWQGGGDR